MNVLINGLGNIGTTIANVCLSYKDLLGIENVFVFKNKPEAWLDEDVLRLKERGAVVISSAVTTLESIGDQIDYIFECRDHETIQRTPKLYESFSRLRGIVAQGSEHDHGMAVMSGVNMDLARTKFKTHVVSCNSHGITAVLQAFAGSRLERLIDADVVVVRRSEDVGASEKLVGSNVIVRHGDAAYGTHHATDVRLLFQSLGIVCPLTTSDMNTPSQLLHAFRFHLMLRAPMSQQEALTCLAQHPFCAITEKFDSNKIFELGRRYGFQGRIFSHAIVCTSSILIQGQSIKGWAFIPQEGNSILSTMESFLHQTNHPDVSMTMARLTAELLRHWW